MCLETPILLLTSVFLPGALSSLGDCCPSGDLPALQIRFGWVTASVDGAQVYWGHFILLLSIAHNRLFFFFNCWFPAKPDKTSCSVPEWRQS